MLWVTMLIMFVSGLGQWKWWHAALFCAAGVAALEAIAFSIDPKLVLHASVALRLVAFVVSGALAFGLGYLIKRLFRLRS